MNILAKKIKENIVNRNVAPKNNPKTKTLKGVILKDSALPTPISDFKTGLIKTVCCLTKTQQTSYQQ